MYGRGNDLRRHGGFGEVEDPELYPGRQNAPSFIPPGGGIVSDASRGLDPPPVPTIRRCTIGESAQLIGAQNVLALRANPYRKSLVIQNNGVVAVPANSAAIRVGFGKPASVQFSYRIVSDGVFEPDVVPTDEIWLVAESAVLQQVTVLEG